MKLLEIYATISAVLFFSFNGAYVGAMDTAECKNILRELLESQMNTIVPCIKDLGYQTGKERSDHFYCIMKCMLIQAGTLTKEGQVTVRQAVEFVLEKVPLEIMEKAFSEITKCTKHASGNLVDPADKQCNKYGPLIGCSINVIMNLCA